MSYVPPHKRHENIALRASSVPPLSKLNKKPGKDDKTIIYAYDYISRLFLVGVHDDDEDYFHLQLVPVSSEWKRDTEEKSLGILVKSDFVKPENPWLWVSEKVEDVLILGFGRAKKMLLSYRSEQVKLRLIFRFGKILFHSEPGTPPSTNNLLYGSSETVRDGLLTKVSALKKLKKSFQTNVPKSYVENIGYKAVPDMGFSIEETKELYLVKTDLNVLRHLVLDISCLDQDLDMRLMVDSKRTLTNLSENEIKSLKELTDSAVIDPNVKGGLKWPLGKSSCADRYNVCGVWHTVTTTYRNQTLKLQITDADRYDFRTGVGGTTREVDLKLKALSAILLKEENVERKCVSDMLNDCLKAVWDYFLKLV
ncbi:hypothetical protein CARUB_v10017482mg [Capsella rubella]|uniref:DUF7903 domain-containing protein n=1 Tax=Capsella rubella TaxID=81985 RepID=R0FQ58_9BRAS|nr:hypothetical protein CARUB_v10017482mg [Capsella rubella]